MRVLLALIVTLLFTGGAVAQSCSSLRAQLRSAEAGGGGGGNAALKRQHRAYGCHISKGWGRDRACAGIEAKMARGGGRNSARVRQLRRQVSRACNTNRRERTAQRQRQAPQQPTRLRAVANSSRVMAVTPSRSSGRRNGGGNIFSNLFGNLAPPRDEVIVVRPGDRYDGRVEQVNLDVDRAPRTSGSGATFSLATGSGRKGRLRVGSSRTVCVRLCDGFYFPINNRSHSDNFYEELAMCVGRCPGADVSLYVHNNQSAVEGMRSTMTGEAYVNLPTAFVYRRKSVNNCSCRAATTVATLPSAEDALREAGLGDNSEAKDEGTVQDARWARFQAVYDETGKPLHLFPKLGRKRGEPKSEDEPSAAEKPALTPLPRNAPEGPPVPLAVAGNYGDEEVRKIGSEAYTAAIAASLTAETERDKRGPSPVRSTAITVVPLAPGPREPQEDRRADAPILAPGPSASLDKDLAPTLFAASNPR